MCSEYGSFLSCVVVVASSSRMNSKWSLRVLKPCFVWYSEWEKRDVFVRTRRKECRSLVHLKISHKRFRGNAFLSDRMSACVFVFFYHFLRERQGAQREREKNKPCWGGYAFQDGGGEQLFFVFSETAVGGDREVRRYLFHTCASEIESNWSQILGWSE